MLGNISKSSGRLTKQAMLTDKEMKCGSNSGKHRICL